MRSHNTRSGGQGHITIGVKRTVIHLGGHGWRQVDRDAVAEQLAVGSGAVVRTNSHCVRVSVQQRERNVLELRRGANRRPLKYHGARAICDVLHLHFVAVNATLRVFERVPRDTKLRCANDVQVTQV